MWTSTIEFAENETQGNFKVEIHLGLGFKLVVNKKKPANLQEILNYKK